MAEVITRNVSGNEVTYKYHHTSTARGYVSVKAEDGIEKPYKGRFGEGIKIYKHNRMSNIYCYVEYWIKQ